MGMTVRLRTNVGRSLRNTSTTLASTTPKMW